MEVRKVKVIVNPKAGMGRGQRCLKKIEKWRDRIAKEKGIEVDIEITERTAQKNTINLAKKAAREGHDLIISVGGDGTNNLIANGIVGCDIPVGFVPAGNGNDFAKALGIPKDIEKALDIIIQGKTKTVDLGKVNNRYFVNIFAVGFAAKVVQFSEGFKQRHWRLAKSLPLLNLSIYLFAFLRELIRKPEYPYLEVKISNGKKPMERMVGEVIFVSVSNGPTTGGLFKIAPQADLSDGLLDICWLAKVPRRRARFLWKGIKGSHHSLPEVRTLPDGRLPQAFSLTISSLENRNLPCHADGEPLEAEKEYKIAILPKALNVIVP